MVARLHPSRLAGSLRPASFSYADVPYRITGYDELRRDPRNTITFAADYNKEISHRVESMGADGRLLIASDGKVQHANLSEKLLVLVLVRLTNFIPGGGIWMNTQRPEWNDANNALVGYGVSVVTLNYLRRLLAFVQDSVWPMLGSAPVPVSASVVTLAEQVGAALDRHKDVLDNPTISAQKRRALVDDLSSAGANYRRSLYADGLKPSQPIEATKLQSLFATALKFVDHSLRTNRRNDHLFHAYNLLEFREEAGELEIHHLPEMLEGQVAVLSSGLLSAGEVVQLLKAMRHSAIFREDLHTYLLYPDRQLPGFLARNVISDTAWDSCALFEEMINRDEHRLVQRDVAGNARFHADLVDGEALERVLTELAKDSTWASSIPDAADQIRVVYEGVFNHRAFTGRSGGMFGFEGLGCVYWHMVAKLLLAVQENLVAAQVADSPDVPALIEAYYDVRAGLGFNHPPEVFGAFPTDPYSHTPGHSGAQQPGMTGQVKEEILTRFGELGVQFAGGQVAFNPTFLRASEFNANATQFDYVDFDGNPQILSLPEASLAFTLTGVPIVYQHVTGTSEYAVYCGTEVEPAQAKVGTLLDAEASHDLLQRANKIHHIVVKFGDDFCFLD